MNTATVPLVRAAISTCFLLLLLAASSIAGAAGTHNSHVTATTATAALPLSAQENGLFRVLVTLNADFRPEGTLTASAHAVQRKGIRSAQQTLLARLAGTRHKVIAAYEVFPVIAMEVDAATLAYLQSAPDVRSVQEDILLSPSDLESNATLHAQVPLSLGYDGTGWAVAIIDSGVQTNHPFLVGKVIAEACFSTTNAGLSSFSLCPNGQSTSGATPGQAGSGAGVNCDVAQFNDCKHGTHLAGIAVGADYPGGPGYNGIAPGAKLIAIQVFSRFTTAGQCGLAPAPCVKALSSDVIAALQYVHTTIRPTFTNIASVNLSFGETVNPAACDGSPMKPAIDTLRSVNIATVAAAGNFGSPGLTEPACVSTAVSVGSTNDLDKLATFSNRSSSMSLLAPGVTINSSVPASAFGNVDGTSASAAAVTGAWALVMQQNPGFTVTQALNLLRTTGVPVSIPSGATVPRMRLGDAFGVPTLPLTITQSFAPSSIANGGTSILSITLNNPNGVALTGTSFIDTFPGGMTTSATPGVTNTCGGTAVAAPTSLSLSLTGGIVPATGSCTITAQVVVSGSGNVVNTLPVHSVRSANGGENAAAGSGTVALPDSNLMVQDGSFALGGTPVPWTAASTNFGSPFCDIGCGVGEPRTGLYYLWMGGTLSAETSSMQQTQVIPVGPHLLELYLWWMDAPDPAATFKILIDGTPVLTITGANSGPYRERYTRVAADVSAFADGNPHVLKIEQVNGAFALPTNIFVDDVSLTPVVPSFSVTFQSNGGSAVGGQTISSGALAIKPVKPTLAANTFLGWYSDPGLTAPFTFTTPVTANLTLYAKWAVSNYIVSFNANSGSEVAPQIIAHGATATLPIVPTRSGFTFAGWYSDAGLNNAFNFSTPITADITLFAKWTPSVNTYTVTFNSNGGSAVTPQAIQQGQTATQPPNPTKAGNAFGGWYSDAGLTSAFNFSTPIVADITLFAKWTANVYTVSFNSNGGSAVNSQLVTHGSAATQPPNPTRATFTFGGWYSDAGLTTPFNFASPITADITLFAKWTLNNYTVTFNSNGGSAVNSQVIAHGATATQPPAPTKTGSTFGGWYSDAGLINPFNFATAITADITLFAKWTLNTYTVTFNSNGGTAVNSQVVAHGSTATQPTPPTKTGNTFGGWYSDAGLANAFNFATPITGDITLFAKWTLNNYTVSFNSNGGTAVNSQVVAHGGTATQPTPPTKTGSAFGGWYSDAGLTSPFNFATPITADITLFAKWTLNIYTVSFNSNGGSAVASQQVAHGSTTPPPADPTRTGSVFAGWYSDAGLTSAFNFSTPITGNITLFAKWTLNTYTVTFNSNGGSAVPAQFIGHGSTATQPPAPTKTGNVFDGWYSDAGLTTAFNFATPITANLTLFAKWIPNLYTVTFNSNGGTAVNSQSVPHGSPATEPPQPTKPDSTFGGWYTDAGLTSVFDFVTPITADITLYAKWGGQPTLDIDGNGTYDPKTDGLMVMRYMMGFRSGALIDAAIFGTPERDNAVAILTYLIAIKAKLDVDGNGEFDPLSDGVMIIRYLQGLRGQALIEGAIGGGTPTRFTSDDIESWLSGLTPN